MSHRFSKTLAIRQLAKIVLPAAFAAFLALGTSPARADDTAFQASYHGQSSVQLDGGDGGSGNLLIDGILPGDATFLPGSMGYFDQAVDPINPNVLNGVFMLYGADNGTVTGTYQGTQTAPDDDGWMQISGTYHIADGWMQAFGPAIGSGAISGSVNVNTGEMIVQLIGTVSPATPNPS